MSLSLLRQWVSSKLPDGGRKARRSSLGQRSPRRGRRCVRPMLESLEERCLLSGNPGLSFTSIGGQIVGALASIVAAGASPPNGLTPAALDAWYLQAGENVIGGALNLTSGILWAAGQTATGQSLRIAGDSAQFMAALGHAWSLEGILNNNPTTPDRTELQNELQADYGNITSYEIALSGDITSLFNGQVPKVIGDSLEALHDSLGLLLDLGQNPPNPANVTADVANLLGDFLALVNDALGSAASAQPLEVDMVFPDPDPQAVPVTGMNFYGEIAEFSDPYGLQLPPGDYSALINWGDGSSSTGQIVNDPYLGWYDVFGSHTYAQSGNYPVSVVVLGASDDTQGQAEQNATIGPCIVPSPAQAIYAGSIVVGQTFNGQLFSFYSADDSSQILQGTTAVINWGDGTSSLGQFDYVQGTIQVLVAGSHTYTQAGNYTVGVQITGPDGSTTSGTTTIDVVPQGLAVNGQNSNIAGLTFNGTLATFSEPDGDTNPNDYSANINWDDNTQPDGGQSDGQIVSNGNGTFSVLGSYTYAQPGQYMPTVTIDDNADSYGTSVQPTLTVGTSLSVNAITATAGQTFNGPVATFTWDDPNVQASDFQAGIGWGDGTGTDPNVQIVSNGNGSFSILGSHTYYGNGTYDVDVQLLPPGDADGPGPAIDTTGTATVGASGLTVTAENLSFSPSPSANSSTAGVLSAAASGGGNVNGTLATFTAPAGATASDYTATINWGDGSSNSSGDGSGSVSVVANANGTFNVVGSHTYSQIESYLIGIQVSDNNGNLASAFGLVSPLPPTSSVNPLPATETSPTFTVSWSGSDPNGPGIASYNIYVSVNGGAFTPWLTNTTQTSATYTGQAGQSYGFYSVAIDQNGLAQPTPAGAQATTTVLLSSGGGGGGGGSQSGGEGSTSSGSGSNPGNGGVNPIIQEIEQIIAQIEAEIQQFRNVELAMEQEVLTIVSNLLRSTP
ncbi:MAG TPA: hypothetical protein VMG10_16955 [Gemmataceae bacterium]|nr:hypothetical protein [Gemmataceae bacterium]